MGVGIAYVFAAAGFDTTVVEPDPQRVTAVRETVALAAADGARRGKLGQHNASDVTERLRVVAAIAELPRSLDLAIESVPERFELKEHVLLEIEHRDPLLIATNTSALSITRLATGLAEPSTFVGLHFFNPVWSLPLVEVVRGSLTSDATVEGAMAFVAALGKQSITVHDSPGFATSRLDLIASLEAMRMLQDGVASAADIDRAMVLAYRHPTGPLRLSDIVGLDVRLDIARHLQRELGERFAPPRLLKELVDAGHLGVKSGKGFFEWRTTKESQ